MDKNWFLKRGMAKDVEANPILFYRLKINLPFNSHSNVNTITVPLDAFYEK